MEGDASHDQAHVTGETKGQHQEKATQALEGAKVKTLQAKEKAHETAQAAKDRLSGSTQTQATKDHTGETKEPVPDAAEGGKEKTGGTLQAATEQVKSAAAGAADAVKRTFGVGEGDNQKTN